MTQKEKEAFAIAVTDIPLPSSGAARDCKYAVGNPLKRKVSMDKSCM